MDWPVGNSMGLADANEHRLVPILTPRKGDGMNAQEQFNREMEKATDRLKFIGLELERYRKQHGSITWANVGDIENVNAYLADALQFLARGEQA